MHVRLRDCFVELGAYIQLSHVTIKFHSAIKTLDRVFNRFKEITAGSVRFFIH